MIHLIGLPHTSLDERAFPSCAFTTKAAKWTRILKMIGQDVTAYWAGGSNTVDCEIVELLTEEERLEFFGTEIGSSLPNDLKWEPHVPYWKLLNNRAIEELEKRLLPGDIIAVQMGRSHGPVIDRFCKEYTVIEPAVGYEGIANGTFACFESYAWMHNRYGALQVGDGRAFDAVIPGFVEQDDFEVASDGGYALFVGRLISRKGPHIAAQVANLAGLPLVVAGAGGVETPTGCHIPDMKLDLDPCIYRGVVGPVQRKKLMARASVLIVPTMYLEPFGTVHAEALMSGVPVVASDWGVFTETVVNGVDGYRFRSQAMAVEGVLKARELRGQALRDRAIDRFSLEAVAPQFDEWLWRLSTLRDGSGGWYAPARSS